MVSNNTSNPANLGSFTPQSPVYSRHSTKPSSDIPIHPEGADSLYLEHTAEPPAPPTVKPAKFGSTIGAISGSIAGGVVGGVAAALIGIPSLIVGIFFHPALLVALASPLLIPAGMAIGAMMGGAASHKKSD